MLVLLPPSETKAIGGARSPLRWEQLSFHELHPVRLTVVKALGELCTDLGAARAAIGVPPSKDHELAQNTLLLTNPTVPAIERYTGVLYDALDVPSMTRVQRAKAQDRLAICSALFGLLRPDDEIPFYRLSAHSKLPGPGSRTEPGPMAPLWREVINSVGAQYADGLVVDLRSGGYRAFGEFPGAVTARVVTRSKTGELVVVSHFNKHTKGLLARALAVTRAKVEVPHDVVRVARTAGLRASLVGETQIEIRTE